MLRFWTLGTKMPLTRRVHWNILCTTRAGRIRKSYYCFLYAFFFYYPLYNCDIWLRGPVLKTSVLVAYSYIYIHTPFIHNPFSSPQVSVFGIMLAMVVYRLPWKLGIF